MKGSKGFEAPLGVIQRIRLCNPRRASIAGAAEDIESETHLGNPESAAKIEKYLFKIEQTER
jgi:hypothetical protein